MLFSKRLSKRCSVDSLLENDLENDIDASSGKLEFLINSPQSGSVVPTWVSKAKDLLNKAKKSNFPPSAIKKLETLISGAEQSIVIAQKIDRLEKQVKLVTKQALTPKVKEWLTAIETMTNDYMKKYPKFRNLLDSLLSEIEYARRDRSR